MNSSDNEFNEEVRQPIWMDGLTYKRYEQIMNKYNLPNLVEETHRALLSHYSANAPWDYSREAQIELQDLSCYFKMVEKSASDALKRLEREQAEVAVARNRTELIGYMERGAGYLEYIKDIDGWNFEKGTEEDVKKVLEWSKQCLKGCYVWYYGLSALLYSKPEYYVQFVICDIDGEFELCVPNHTHYDTREVSCYTDKVTPSDLRITFKEFGGSIIKTIARGADEAELNENFKKWLAEYEKPELNDDLKRFMDKQKDNFFKHKVIKAGFDCFAKILANNVELRP